MIYDTFLSDWEKIPHVSEITFNEQAQQSGIVTSGSAGQEIALCGPVVTTGTLGLVCHDGFGPLVLCVNSNYRIRWSSNCNFIYDAGDGEPLESGALVAGTYWEADIKITGLPVNLNVSQGGAIIYVYTWRLVRWVHTPACQDPGSF